MKRRAKPAPPPNFPPRLRIPKDARVCDWRVGGDIGMGDKSPRFTVDLPLPPVEDDDKPEAAK